MKKITLLLSAAFLSMQVNAQQTKSTADKDAEDMKKKAEMDITKLPDGWQKAGSLLLGFNYTNQSFWVGASEPYNATFNGGITYNATRKKGKTLWINDLSFLYASTSTKSTNGEFRKTTDLLTLTSMYAPQIKPKWFWAINADLRTQVFPGYDYKSTPVNGKYTQNSGFMTPGYVRIGLGVMYTPNPKLRIYYSPLTANITTKLGKFADGIARDGVPADKTTTFGLGSLLRADYTNTFKTGTFFGDVAFKSRLDLFTDYLDRPFVVTDMDWVNSFGFNITKLISASALVNLRYYDRQIQRLQNQNMFGLGFSYKL
jgi:hypothetical protein